MYWDIEKYILNRLKYDLHISYNSFKSSREYAKHKLSKEEFNKILESLKERGFITYSIDTGNIFRGDIINVYITTEGEKYYMENLS